MTKRLSIQSETSISDLRSLLLKEKNGLAVKRLMALILCLEGKQKRQDIAQQVGLNRQALRDLIVRYNAKGLAALYNVNGRKMPRRISAEDEAKFAKIVETPPDIERDGVVRWRIVDLQAKVLQEFNVEYSATSIARILKRLRFSHISARPQHPKAGVAAQEAFKKTFKDL